MIIRIIIIFFVLPLAAQSLRVEQLADSLPLGFDARVHGHLHDRQGRFWMAAANGIFVYEQEQWRRFSDSDFERQPASGRQFLETSDGAIWMRADTGIFRYEAGTWSVLLPTLALRSATPTPQGSLLLWTMQGTVLELFADAEIEYLWDIPLNNNSPYAFDSQGALWLAQDAYLYRYHRQGCDSFPLIANEAGIVLPTYYLLADAQGGLLLFFGDRIERFDNERFATIHVAECTCCTAQSLSANRSGDLWLAVNGDLLRQERAAWHIPRQLLRLAELCSIVLLDSQTRLWIADEYAVWCYDTRRESLEKAWEETEPQPPALFWEDAKGRIWLWRKTGTAVLRFSVD